MPKALDITNQKFGRLTAKYKAQTRNKKTFWMCECECGNMKEIATTALRSGAVKSCGCLLKEYNQSKTDLVGTIFGKLKVIKEIEKPLNFKRVGTYWLCQCECGNYHKAIYSDLARGNVKSCGCLTREAKSTIKDEVLNKYGKLTVLKRDFNSNGTAAKWFCQCECGGIISVYGYNLRNGFTISCGCINSKGEELISNLLEKNNIKFIKQYDFENCIYPSGFKAKFDFAILNKDNSLSHLIEFDGKQHSEVVEYFGGLKGFEERKERDNFKDSFCRENNIKLLRINSFKNLTLEKLFDII